MASIPQAGACIVSRNVLSGAGRVRWMVREESLGQPDNGWRIWSEIDDEAFLADPENLTLADYNEVCDIEPLLVAIFDFPVGSDLQVVDEGGGKRLVSTPTGEEIPEEVHYRPPSGS